MKEAWSVIIVVLQIVGSLGLFLYGMKLMSESLQKVAGSKMRQIMGTLTNNRFKGILTGMFVTTTIQSSSATTVMVVSFVNAGLLTLSGAIAVIMGANIGTTVTAWLISLLGFKVSMSAISIPLIAMSLPFLFSKKSKQKSIGELIVGFAILFIGLAFLKDSIPTITEDGAIAKWLEGITNWGFGSVILFVLVGTILTLVLQSSSATMAFTLVLVAQGVIPFNLACAMVLGENIGTTITANLAAMVANTQAKRAARAHLLFNVIGVIWVLILFNPFLNLIGNFMESKYGIDVFAQSFNSNTSEAILPIGLSIFHTSFNIINTLLMVGFIKLIEKIVIKLVPFNEEEDDFKLQHISSGFVSTSEIGLVQAKKEIAAYGKRAQKMFNFIPDMLTEKKPKKYAANIERIVKYEDIIDETEVEISKFLSKLIEGNISKHSAKRIKSYYDIIDNIESIGDLSYQITMITEKKNLNKIWFTQDLRNNFFKIHSKANESLELMNKHLSQEYREVDLQKALNLEVEINEMRDCLRDKHFENLNNDPDYNLNAGLIYNQLISLCEKVGDYVINVSQAIYGAKIPEIEDVE